MVEKVRLRVRRGEVEVEAEGPVDFVERHVADVLSGTAPNALDVKAPGEAEARKGRLNDFVSAKAPGNQLELLTVMAVWGKEVEQLEQFGEAEFERLYKLAGQKRPADMANTMAQVASKRAWIESVGGGRYRLTARGEDHVRYELGRRPDRSGNP